MKLAISIEVPMSEFWEMTPYELHLKSIDYWEKQKNKFKEKLTLEYYNAMWTIQWMGKKSQHPKPLNEILDGLYPEKQNKKVMTDEQMLDQVKVLNMLFGGEMNS